MPTENRSSKTEMVSVPPYIGREPLVGRYHPAQCRRCGWVGSSEELTEDDAQCTRDIGDRLCLGDCDELERHDLLSIIQAMAAPQPHPDPIAWMVGTAFWWTKEEAERDAAETGKTITPIGPMSGIVPADEHQGEPVARVEVGADRNACAMIIDQEWLRQLKDKAEHLVVHLYTHADPGEVERLRAKMSELLDAFAESQVEVIRRGNMLAEQDALLREAHEELVCRDSPVAQRIIAALSASAEPSAPVTLCASEIGFHAETGICDSQAIISRIKGLGITYFRFMPDRFGDCLWFFNCRNVPADLPEWVEVKAVTAKDWIGRGGMTEDIAKEIEADAGKDDGAPVEIDERAENAERYLFLRNRAEQACPGKERCLSVSVEDWSCNLGPEPEGIAVCNAWSSMDLFGEELDAEIDKARAALERKPS